MSARIHSSAGASSETGSVERETALGNDEAQEFYASFVKPGELTHNSVLGRHGVLGRRAAPAALLRTARALKRG